MKLKKSLEDDVKDEKMTNISQNIPDSALKKPAITGIDCINGSLQYHPPRLDGPCSLAVMCRNSRNHTMCVIMYQMCKCVHALAHLVHYVGEIPIYLI